MLNEFVQASLPASFPTRLEIDTKDVWNGFFIHSLLLEHTEQQTNLVLQHNARSQAERLKPQLEARNARMAGPGQEQWSHACDSCCWVFVGEDDVQCKFCYLSRSIYLIIRKIKFALQLPTALRSVIHAV